MRNKFGAAALCLLLSAVIYAAAKGDLNGLRDVVRADVSSMGAVMGLSTKAAAVASDQPIQSLASELPAHDATVGKLAGSASTSGGAASYSIPIALPPGRRGMQPSLSLDYSSRAGNGIAGMGWSLSGLSSLHRCPATLDQDNSVRAVALTNADKLCLDGQRLVATSGTYGTLGATYDTEIDSFVRVTQLGGDLQSASTYFKVETKSGDILWYGNDSTGTHPAPVIPGGVTVPLSWMLVRKEDRVGNFMRYSYTNYGNGEVLLNSILYTGFGTTDGDRHVDFTYQARPTSTSSVANDIASSYIAGGLTMQTQRLTQVTSYYGTQQVRQYQLDYGAAPSAASGRSLLRGVTDCGFADGSTTPVCRPETKFAWQESAVQSSFHAFSLPAGLPNQEFSSLTPLGDLDGDGVQELDAHYADYTNQTDGTDYLVSLNADKSVRGVVSVSSLGLSNAIIPGNTLLFSHNGRTDLVSTQVISGSEHVFVTVWNGTTTAFVASAFTTYDLGLSLPYCSTLLTGDLNGDGYTDLIVSYPTAPASGPTACYDQEVPGATQTMAVYLGKPDSSPGTPTVQSTPVLTRVLPYVVRPADGAYLNYVPYQVKDFDGDGLADVFLSRPSIMSFPLGAAPQNVEHDKPQMLMFSRVSGGAFTLGGTGNEYDTFAAFAAAAAPLQADETNDEAYTQMADVNGDGLPDLISIKVGSDGNGYWSVRLNNGGHYGPRMVTTSQRGIEHCAADNGGYQWGTCADRWQPMLSPLLRTGDTDHDGRAEILAPRAYAARICTMTQQTNLNGDKELVSTYSCPQNIMTDDPDVPALDPITPDKIHKLYSGAGSPYDPSAYFMDSVRFVQNAAGGIDAAVVKTPIIQSGAPGNDEYGSSDTLDVYGTGMTDEVAPIGWGVPPPQAGSFNYYTSVPYSDPNDPQDYPATLPDGTPISNFANRQWSYFLSEDIGAGFNPDGKTAEQTDLMAMVTDGFGAETVWTYYPLSSAAGRTAGQTPLYSIPTDPAQRYVDSANVYFSSSMPVVSDMAVSDGIGGFHALRYGYSQAMYNTQGRGFQGFRTIIEEDLTSGLRTTTTFDQKFPLVSKVVDVVVNAMTRSGTAAPIRHETYTWLCDLANRADTSACTPQNGNAVVKFPFLDEHDTTTYDATVALQTAGTPQAIGLVQDINASDLNCAGTISTTSGYDAHGNLLGHVVLASDLGTGAGGLRAFVTQRCVNTVANYTVNTSNWWLDKLNNTTVTSKIAYNATNHPLPTGASNPPQTLTTTYLWNTDRTKQQETVQSGIANQQRVTTYVYSNSPNYGLPTAVAVAASGDPNGTRSSGIAYSGDGYFPYLMSNALGQSSSVVTGARDGQPTLTVDANGLRTLMTYDPFGQLVHTQFHGTSDSVLREPDRWMALVWCAGRCGPGPQSIYSKTDVQDGSPTRIAGYDMLGRELISTQRQQDGSQPLVQTTYDGLGRVASQSTPYLTSAGLFWTTFQYDPLNRVIQKVVPKGAEDGRGDQKTTYTYSGLQTAIQVCGTADVGTSKCLNMTRTTDSLGQYMETTDASTPGGVTQYWTDANGHTLALKDANGSITTAAYNAIGQRSSVSDPNQGTWSFTYDALGELLTQIDARGIVTSSAYDKLGRPLNRTAIVDVTGDGVADTVVDSWTYDPLNGIGELATSQRMVYPSQVIANGAIERSQVHTYDTLARLIETDTSQQIATGSYKAYTETMAYDGYYGRPKSIGYPNGEAVGTYYSKYGQPIASFNPLDGSAYRIVTAVDARGNPTTAVLGGASVSATTGLLTDARSYRPTTGELLEIQTTKSGTAVRQLDYQSDVFGNLTQQSLNSGATVESYLYDPLQRMTQAARTGAVNTSIAYGYDAAGNFTYKTDFSTTGTAYVYTSGTCGGGPNAVKSIALATGGTRTYCYDKNGNLTSDNAGLAVKYDHDNLAYQTTRSNMTINLAYGPDNLHTREWGSDGTKVYLDGGYEDWISQGSTKVYVGTEAEITNNGGTRTVNYLLTDRLGSVDSIANSAGTLIETRGSDAFGKPRLGTWADAPPPAQLQSTAITAHGFTGHEHLNSVQLIHMNGRVYDYQLGRFLSVDPHIQAPLNSQSLNPYSYIMNNPLAGTDPTGYDGEDAGGSASSGDSDIHDQKTTCSHDCDAMSADSLAATGGHVTQVADDAPASGQQANGAQKQGMNAQAQAQPSNVPPPAANPDGAPNNNAATEATDKKNAADFDFNDAGTDWLKKVEGDHLKPYDDTTGKDITSWNSHATIGVGHLIKTKDEFLTYKGGITEEQSDTIRKSDMQDAITTVRTSVTVTVTQDQFNALAAFAYNIGPGNFRSSSALQMINDPTLKLPLNGYSSLKDAWGAFNKQKNDKGVPIFVQGLQNRRDAEYKIYSDGKYETW